jgi:TonB family protein
VLLQLGCPYMAKGDRAVRVARALRHALFACAALAHGRPAAAQPGAAITPPTVLTHVDASYPRAAVPSGVHADVELVVTVDADGHVSDVKVAQSGGPELDEAAITAIRQWTFRPALRGKTPVASRIRVPFHFAPPATGVEAEPPLVGALRGALAARISRPVAPPTSSFASVPSRRYPGRTLPTS